VQNFEPLVAQAYSPKGNILPCVDFKSFGLKPCPFGTQKRQLYTYIVVCFKLKIPVLRHAKRLQH
jgi:hypothetical protein